MSEQGTGERVDGQAEMRSGPVGAARAPLALDPEERGRRLFRLAVPFYLAMAAIAWIWRGGVRGEPVFRAPGVDAVSVWATADTVAAGLALGLAIVALSAAWTSRLPSGRAVSEFLGRTIGRIGLVQSTVLAVASGLGEEMLFRGALQPEVGLVFASLLFGLAHLVPRWPIVIWSLYAVAIGAVFGWVFEATGSLWGPVVAHAVVNGVNLPILSRRYGGLPVIELDAVPGASAGLDDARDRVHLDEGTER